MFKPHLKNLRVGFTTNQTIDPSSSIQLDDVTSGFLPNRLTSAQIIAISSPAAGLLVYNISTNQFNYYTGTSWVALSASVGASYVGVRIVSSGDSDNALSTDQFIAWNSAATQVKAQIIPISSAATAGRMITVKDEIGTANTWNITISALSGSTIEGNANYVLKVNHAAVTLIADGVGNWMVI